MRRILGTRILPQGLLVAASILAMSCSGSTGGALISLPFQAGGVARDASQPFSFTTPTGWNVTLDRALVATGPFYFNVSPPSTSAFRSGVVIVQATEQVIVDALDPTMKDVTGGASGESGVAVSVEIGLLAPDTTNAGSPDADTLGNGFAFVSGTATQETATGTTVVPFQGRIVIDSSLVTATEPLADLQRVKGAGVSLTFAATPQILELRIDPTHWFDQVDFASLVVGTAPAPAGGYTWNIDTCAAMPGPPCSFATLLLEGVKGESGVYQFDLVAAATP